MSGKACTVYILRWVCTSHVSDGVPHPNSQVNSVDSASTKIKMIECMYAYTYAYAYAYVYMYMYVYACVYAYAYVYVYVYAYVYVYCVSVCVSVCVRVGACVCVCGVCMSVDSSMPNGCVSPDFDQF